MQRQILIGTACGLLAAMVFALAAVGPIPTRVLFFFITPLPVFIAGLSAGWATATIAGIAGAFAMAAMSNPLAGAVFAATQLVPATILCYFALLSRDAPQTPDQKTPTNPNDSREWYPIGRIVLWAVAIAIILAIGAMAIVATDMDTLKALLRERLDELIDAQIPLGSDGKATKTVSEEDRAYMTDVTLQLLPALTALTIAASLLLNMWLAARITRGTDILTRPWPDIPAMTFPPGTPLVFAACLLASSFLTGFAGLAASAASGGMFFAYILMGLAIIHHITRGNEWRPFALMMLYASMIAFNTAFCVLIAIVGLAEPVSPFRRKIKSEPPPGPPRRPPGNDND